MKNKLASIVLSAAMLSSGFAFADCDPKVYVGGELQAIKNRSSVKPLGRGAEEIYRSDNKPLMGNNKKGFGISPIIGARINEYVGAELGYDFLARQKLKITRSFLRLNQQENFRFQHRNVHADVLGYVPVSSDVNLIGSAGVGRLTSKVTENTKLFNGQSLNLAQRTSKTGLRLGVGGEYKIDENLSARLMLRNQKGNKLVKSMNSASLGLFYQF